MAIDIERHGFDRRRPDRYPSDFNIDDHVLNVGYAFLHIVGSAHQLRHVSLRGHLHYQHEELYEKQGAWYTADVVRWLRWISTWGKDEREKNELPVELINLALNIRLGLLSHGLTAEHPDGV